jgi:hypothetical protein
VFGRLSEKVDLIVTLSKRHPAMDVSDTPGESNLLQFREEKVKCIAVFRKDQ